MDTLLATTPPEAEPITEGGARAVRRDQQLSRITEAAKACFVRSGFQGASMHHICAEAGMSPGALYRYFPSKEAIIESIAEADRRQDVEIIAPLLWQASVVDGLVAAAMAHLRYIHGSGNAPLFVEIRAEAMRNEAVRRSSEHCMQEARDAFRARLDKALADREIDPVVDLDTLLRILMAVGEGLAMNDLPANGVAPGDIEAALRAMLVALLRPAAAPQRPAD